MKTGRTNPQSHAHPGMEPSPLPWGEVTRRIRKGDEASFQALYNRFFDSIFRHVQHLCGRDESTCLDIVQETFLKIIRSMKSIDNEPQLSAWIRIVTRTTTLDWLRKQSRCDARQKRLAESGTHGDPVDGEDDSQQIQDAARLMWIEEQLKNLPEELQTMISLKYRLGWSLKRIGARFGMKTGAVDGRIRRAINSIKTQARLAKLELDEPAESLP